MPTKKGTRLGHRSALTKLLKKFEEVKSNEDSDRDELTTILDLIVDKQKFLTDLNNQIFSELSEEELEEEISESDEYNVMVETKIRKMRKILEVNPVAHKSPSFPVSESMLNPLAESFDVNRNQTSSFNSHHTFGNMSSSSSHFHKLPKLELSKFDGNILNWQAFWDSYETAVHTNPSLSDAQKFNYLKSLLQNDALTTVSGFALTNMNYGRAIDILQQRYGQSQQITHAYMQTLLELPAPNNNVQSCRSFYNKSETLIRGLESMGKSQESYGDMLVPVMLKKLPSRIKENLMREHGLKEWSVDELRLSLLREISIMEASQTNNLDLNSTDQTYSTVYLAKTKTMSNNARNFKQATNNVITHRRKSCVYCGESHSPTTCPKVSDPKSRIEILKQKRACFNCLGNHRVADCRSRNTCKNCNRKHHTSICETKLQSGASSTESSNQNTTEKKTPTSDQQTTAITASAFHCTTASQVLLKTAIAPVYSNSDVHVSVDANILFDERAQRSFITEDLAEQLELKPLGTEVISIAGFGGGSNAVRHLKNAKIHVSTDDGCSIEMDVLVVPEIASPVQIQCTY